MSEEPDWESPEVQGRWCVDLRAHVEAYLQDEKYEHGRIAEQPTWAIAPFVALWAIESKDQPEAVGAWVISGDVPMDLVVADQHEHPRDAMHAVADRWLGYAEDARAGRPITALEVRGVGDGQDVAKMLASRAETLHEWAADDELWRASSV